MPIQALNLQVLAKAGSRQIQFGPFLCLPICLSPLFEGLSFQGHCRTWTIPSWPVASFDGSRAECAAAAKVGHKNRKKRCCCWHCRAPPYPLASAHKIAASRTKDKTKAVPFNSHGGKQQHGRGIEASTKVPAAAINC